MPSKLARTLPLSIRGVELPIKTPLLVPSFSSRASIEIGRIFETLQPSITDTFLISAYDVFHSNVQLPSAAIAEVLFLDSGGYEVSSESDMTDPQYLELGNLSEERPRPQWDVENYLVALQSVDPVMPTIVTAFDHPDVRLPVAHQMDKALEVFKDFPDLGREILIKPESTDQRFVEVHKVIAEITKFSQFDVIGITEAELGDSILDRMVNIAQLRNAMDLAHVKKPLHIFGSLDPVCSTLYFLAGADIFDGLSWLRFSFWDEVAMYHKNRGPLEFGIKERESRALARSYEANLHYLRSLGQRLQRYLIDGSEERLGRHYKFFTESLDNLRVELPGVV